MYREKKRNIWVRLEQNGTNLEVFKLSKRKCTENGFKSTTIVSFGTNRAYFGTKSDIPSSCISFVYK